MAEVENKIWGRTEKLLSLPTMQLHRINFIRGGVCSTHYHVGRYNAFYVLDGRLEVARCDPHGLPHTVNRLEEGDAIVVPPGAVHYFRGLSDGAALEIYFPGEMSEHDIVRLAQGYLDR